MKTKRLVLLIATIALAVLAVSSYFAFGVSTVLSGNLGVNTVPPASSVDVISAASYNGNTASSGIGTNSVSFPASTVSTTTTTLSLTIQNTGKGTSVIPSTGVAVSDGDGGNALSFTLTTPTTFPVSLTSGATQVFTWTVTNVNQGTTTIQTTPTVTITPTS